MHAGNEQRLFHYTSAAGLMGIIQNRALWASESNYLNDPSEVSFASTTLVSLLQERIQMGLSETVQHTAESAIALLEHAYVDPNTLDQYREDRSFITSCSRSDQSLTLWRMYGGRNGFSVGFDQELVTAWTGHEYPTDSDDADTVDERERREGLRENVQLEARIHDVGYGPSAVEPIVDDVLLAHAGDPGSHLAESRLREALKMLASVKHEAFADEREVRLVLQAQGDFVANHSIRVSGAGALVAYRKLVFPHEALTSITISPGANVAQTKHALASLLADGGRGAWSHVEVRECNIPFVW